MQASPPWKDQCEGKRSEDPQCCDAVLNWTQTHSVKTATLTIKISPPDSRGYLQEVGRYRSAHRRATRREERSYTSSQNSSRSSTVKFNGGEELKRLVRKGGLIRAADFKDPSSDEPPTPMERQLMNEFFKLMQSANVGDSVGVPPYQPPQRTITQAPKMSEKSSQTSRRGGHFGSPERSQDPHAGLPYWRRPGFDRLAEPPRSHRPRERRKRGQSSRHTRDRHNHNGEPWLPYWRRPVMASAGAYIRANGAGDRQESDSPEDSPVHSESPPKGSPPHCKKSAPTMSRFSEPIPRPSVNDSMRQTASPLLLSELLLLPELRDPPDCKYDANEPRPSRENENFHQQKDAPVKRTGSGQFNSI